MNRRQLLQTSALAIPALALPARSLFAEKPIVPPPIPFSRAVATSYQSNSNIAPPALLASRATQAQLSGLATAHSTWASELANTNNIAQINAAINNNASAIANYNIGNFPMSTVLPRVQQFCPSITQSMLQAGLEQWNASLFAGMQSNGISPSIQNLLQTIQALEAQAGSSSVNYRFSRRHAGPHLVAADYTGGAHLLEVNRFGPLAAIASGILDVMAVFAPEVILCIILGYELTIAGACGIMAGISVIVSGVDDVDDW